ncbi:MAG: starch-binding protein [Clostridium sp.]|nr:starch-binding protein [Clostridium sp.]
MNYKKVKGIIATMLAFITLTSTSIINAKAKVDLDTNEGKVFKIESSDKKNNNKKPFSWDNATVYFALTDRFNNGDKSNDHSYGRGLDRNGNVRPGYEGNPGVFQGGDLKGLTQKVNEGYFTDLGVNAIWITAPYEQVHGFTSGNFGGGSVSESNGRGFPYYGYHGYWALDYSNVDANMGTAEDLKNFVDSAHAKGIRVVMDVVLNHLGYTTMKDCSEYGFGGLAQGWENYYYGSYSNLLGGDGEDAKFYDKNSSTWVNKWWGPDFVRTSAGYAGYPIAQKGDGYTCSLCGLPDVKTESTKEVGIPPLLETKWKKEGRYDKEVNSLNEFFAKRNLPKTPRNYIIKWLTDYIREYGIDGFRCDTAKEVDKESWGALNKEADVAFEEYKANNPDKVLDKNAEFWSTGEHWGFGVGKDDYFTTGGFSSMINFTFKDANLSNIKGKYDELSKVNDDSGFNVLSYLSSHDDFLYDRNNLINGGTCLLLAPGGVQIFYGDESARPLAWQDLFTSDYIDQRYRSFMNWDDLKNPNSNASKVHAHFAKLGTFRNNHLAVGAGKNITLASSPYTFGRTYSKDGVTDKVVCAVGVKGTADIDVSGVFNDGAKVRDAYTGNYSVVRNGKATFAADNNGVVLIEKGDNSPEVGVSVTKKNYFTDSLDLDLFVTGVDKGTYSINGGVEKEYENGDTITIGKDAAFEETTSVTLKAVNEDGKAEQTYSFTKKNPNFYTNVYFKKPSDWGTPKIYAYSDEKQLSKWPGVEMEDIGDGIYKFTSPLGFHDMKVIFTDGIRQTPGQGQPGMSIEDAASVIYEDGVWHEYVEGPTATISKQGGKYIDSLELTLGFNKDCKEAYYKIDDGEYIKYTNGQKILIGKDKNVGDETKVTLKAVGENAISEVSYEFVKTDVKTSKVYCKKPTGWGNLKIYVYNDEVSPTKELSKWPGVDMVNEGDGLYSYTLDNWEGNAYVIFTDGRNQIPAQKQKGYKVEEGKVMMYKDGSFTEISETKKPVASISKESCTFIDTLDLVLGAKDYTKATYSIDDGKEIDYKDGDKITIGKDVAEGSKVKVTLRVTNDTKVDIKNYVYTKEKKVEENTIIYFDNADNWIKPTVYIYNEVNGRVESLGGWPGKAMTLTSRGLYAFIVPKEFENGKVIFSDNGKNQIPSLCKEGLKIQKGKSMLYVDGEWTAIK